MEYVKIKLNAKTFAFQLKIEIYFLLLCISGYSNILQMTISARIIEARKALKISQKDFAKGMCISAQYLSNVEKDCRKVNDRLIKLISMSYGVNERWLKTGEGEMLHKAPEEKLMRVVSIFNELPSDFQDYALQQLDQLLKLRKSQAV